MWEYRGVFSISTKYQRLSFDKQRILEIRSIIDRYHMKDQEKGDRACAAKCFVCEAEECVGVGRSEGWVWGVSDVFWLLWRGSQTDSKEEGFYRSLERIILWLDSSKTFHFLSK